MKKTAEKSRTDIAKEALFVGITATRVLLATRMARKVANGQSITADMVTFVVADVADGMLARRFSVDTPMRRFADALADRISVGLVCASVAKRHIVSRPYIAGLAGCELIGSIANGVHFMRSGEVVQGIGAHKLGGLSMAAFGVTATTGHETQTRITGAAALGINTLLAVNYLGNTLEPAGFADNGIRQITMGEMKYNHR